MMRSIARHRLLPLLLAAGALAAGGTLAACGSGVAPAGPAALSSTPPTPAGEARQAARQILDEVTLPAGFRAAAGEPAGDGGRLARPPSSEADPDLVDLSRFATGPGGARRVVAWFAHHVPRGTERSGGELSSGPGGTAYAVEFSFPAVGQVLDTRRLVVEATGLADGRVGLRFDAQVTWLPAKPAGDRIPAGVTVLTVSLTNGPNPGQPGHPATTTTDPSVVAVVVAEIDALPVAGPGARSCPADYGQVLTLQFFDRAGGPAVAVVRADPAGCEGVEVLQDGRAVAPGLQGSGFATLVERAVGWGG
jgi:hypothetical protein